ncbi:MFS multidrug transporter [Apiospora rasikravindrae]|uniref:MFS multidrug transporter n=1 Tax=Apiospora rasikravindrae TaxID=990691 RepID=A0ABR1U2P7_9PEZI
MQVPRGATLGDIDYIIVSFVYVAEYPAMANALGTVDGVGVAKLAPQKLRISDEEMANAHLAISISGNKPSWMMTTSWNTVGISSSAPCRALTGRRIEWSRQGHRGYWTEFEGIEANHFPAVHQAPRLLAPSTSLQSDLRGTYLPSAEMNNIELHNYPRGHSRTSGDASHSLPVTVHDLNRQDTDESDGELQLAKLDILSGWRLWVTHGCLLCGLFMASLESSIVATALVPISVAFLDGQNANWIVAAYLITYTAFLIIFARLSDLLGRKPTLITAIIIFTSFSAACGCAQTMTQLIILRAFQGVGGAGLYSLAMSIALEVTPFKHIGTATGLFGPTFAFASLLGPVLGGIITTRNSWRWVFFINVPIGVVLLCVIIWIFPANSKPLPIKRRTLSFIDYPGMFLSLLGVVSLIYAVEKGGARQAWAGPDIIATLALGGVGLTGFISWEWVVANTKKPRTQMLPLFPIRLISTRVLGSLFLTSFLSGFPFFITTVFLPQRFQIQNGLSPIEAGLRMLPLLVMSAVGGGLGGPIGSRFNVTWYFLASALALQIVGLGLMTTLPTTGDVSAAQYGYQALMGFGFGCAISSFIVISKLEVSGKDSGITIGAITQVRTLGGLMGIAIAQAVVFGEIFLRLEDVLSWDSLDAILESPRAIANLPPHHKVLAIEAYGVAFNILFKIAAGICAAALVACMGIWRRKPLSYAEHAQRKE